MSRRGPCTKRKFYNRLEALLEPLVKYNDYSAVAYKCEECSFWRKYNVWHYGHIRKNGTVNIKKPDGSFKNVKWREGLND